LYLNMIRNGSNLAFEKCWQTDENEVVLTGGAAGKLVDFCACWIRTYLCRGSSAYAAGSVEGDYDRRTGRTNFENWAKETLISNIPEESVVVFDSAPLHYVRADILQSE
jgi:hypothetical protein